MFELHTRLAEDCIVIGDLSLCTLLMMDDARYPWFILVPRRENIKEIYQLSAEDQCQLAKESSALSQSLMTLFSGDKINMAALGNIVTQLHVHHIVRYHTDETWPSPVWGRGEAQHYTHAERDDLVQLSQQLLNELKAHF